MNNTLDNIYDVQLKATRDGFGEAMVNLGNRNKNVLALSGDLRESLRMVEFGNIFPERFIEVGVAEQNMAGVAAGLALSGKIPYMCSFAVFSPGRNWDQIRVSIACTNANVKIVGGHTGVTVGSDGATHQAMEDIAMMRVLPNMVVVVPADALQTEKATYALAEHIGPAYLRLTRPKTPIFISPSSSFEIGKAQVLRDGSDVTIFACGPLVYQALLAAEELKQDVSVEVINIHTIKPLDKNAVIESAKKTKRVITLEEHQINGGLGGAVAEVLSENCPTRMIRMGMKDMFGESGEADELLVKYGMDKKAVIAAIREILRK